MTIIQYDNCDTDQTPLTAELLDASSIFVSKVNREEFDQVRNAIVFELVKI